MSHINVMGIDPSMSNTGIAIAKVSLESMEIESILCLKLAETKLGGGGKKVRKSSDDLRRAREIQTALTDLTAFYKPAFAVSEIPSGTQSARGSISNGICIGLLACVTVPLIEVSPSEVKLASVGNKTADKEDMVKWAYSLYPNADWLVSARKNEWEIEHSKGFIKKENEHLADAVAAIKAGLKTEQVKGMLSLLKASQGQAKYLNA